MAGTGRKYRRLCGALSVSLLFVIAGCHDGGERRDVNQSEPAPTAGQLCGDDLVLAKTSAALEVITGGKREDIVDDGATLAGAARDIKVRRNSVLSDIGDVCHIAVPSAPRVRRLNVFWQLLPKNSDEPAPKYTTLRMGEGAGAAWDEAYVTFLCSASTAPHVSPAYVSVYVESRGFSTEPRDDVKNLSNAHLTVAHAFSLAIAKEVGCAEEARIPAEPVLIP
ncbi:hypothetical protein [Streptomyces genisteinicus]|uniref:Lipoprotein n=1 Tax=Streptomyces genisteinicus TaxID=2768068 RepID=A0A7H0HS92_9ACTN|nr:hypothetical protein [Streptomyces genisteinicus]QNP63408.1 hypothetical protein IAG43_10985 [Streptomyces genisteinicus]